MDIAYQLEFFRTRFGRFCTRGDLEVFGADLARLNLDIMDAALDQALAAATAAGRPPRDTRLAVLAQYDRIVAAQMQLLPVFFIFESAWRSVVAARLDVVYGRSDWWHPVRERVAAGSEPTAGMELAGKAVPREVILSIVHILNGPRDQIGSVQTTYDLIAAGTLGNLERIIQGHWSAIAQMLSSRGTGGRLTSASFAASFRQVREARNDLFHHRRVRDRKEVVKAAEGLLDALDIHLGNRIASIRASEVPMTFKVQHEDRHS